MCGIAGWIDWDGNAVQGCALLEEMTNTLCCRGPDTSGTWLSRHAALGHRRLVVVDPEGGGQPMVRRRGDRTYVIVYNGELYNTADLHRDLQARGYMFQGHSDTEALLTAFVEWGDDCVHRLNGIFAFAIWSEHDHRLFMVRDRLGVKPLFYAHRGDHFLFGSEPKALLAHPAVDPVVDGEGLAEIFALGPARTPGHGVYRGVFELKPGHTLVFDRRGMRTECYWALESRPHADDLDTTVTRVRELLVDTVERQLISDVPISTLLSGGLDSSAITAIAAEAQRRAGKGTVATFSVDYADNDIHFQADDFQPNADGPWVERMSQALDTQHSRVVIDTPELVDALRDAVRARDLPGMADVDASLLLFCRQIKRQVTVALSGEAADEVFGGYPWFHRADALAASSFPWSTAMDVRSRYLSRELLDRIRPDEYVQQRYQEALQEVPRLAGETPEQGKMREMSYLNITRFMPTLLDRKDRMSMAVGLEVRVPYCDHRLIQYVWNTPWEMKNCDGREKGLLRRALAGILPTDVLYRRKSPYPKTHHPAYLAAMRRWVSDIVSDPGSPLLDLINPRAVRELVSTDAANLHMPWFGQLMSGPQLLAYLGQVDTWLREYRVSLR